MGETKKAMKSDAHTRNGLPDDLFRGVACPDTA
jgi:hypothetical protein